MRLQHWRTAVLGVAAATALVGCSGADEGTAADGAVASPTGVAPTEQTTDEPGSSADPRYADGTYSAEGQYGGGPSFIGVELTLAEDVITGVDVTTRATNPTSLEYQQRFADAVPETVIGRPIDEVRVSRLAGSSSTPDGFNAALEQIKREAAR